MLKLKNDISIPLILKNDNGIRPNGQPDECFYCQQKVGQPHKIDCIILTRTVKVKYSFDIEIEVPYSWNAEDIEFHRNDGSWCANNALKELNKFAKKIDIEGECFCNYFKAKVLEIPEASPYRYNKDHDIVP